MDINKIQLTNEQKECVNFPLDKQVLVINAGPGTGKTEIIKERIKFIIERNRNSKQLILVLTFNKSISLDIWRKLKQLESKGVFFLKKTGEFSKRNVFSSLQIMNRTFHSLCYLIFSKEFEKISEKAFNFIPDKQKMAYSFPFWTDFTSNIVEFDRKKSSWKKLSPSDRLKFIILGKLNKYVLQKKSNKISQELKKALIGNKEILQKITIKKEEKPIIYQKIVYEEYLHEVHLVLEKSGRLDMYHQLKNFSSMSREKNFD